MAACDQGYLCDVCGGEVEDLAESDLYLRYVLGEVEPDVLHTVPERHIRCNPTRAQFIVADGFEPVEVDGFFDKAGLDPDFREAEELRVSRGYLRLCELMGQEGVSLLDYPLPEVRERMAAAARGDGPR